MRQRFPMNAGGGATLPLGLGAVGLPAIAIYFRFVQRESWTVVGIAIGVGAVLCIWAAVWGSRMSGKAIELTDEGIMFPQVLSSEPETILWTGIEDYDSGFDFTEGGGASQSGWLDIIYYGGRRRRIHQGNVLDYNGLESAIRAEIAKRKADG